MCNVQCVARYCGCGNKNAILTVVLFRLISLIIVLVLPFGAICAVLNEFYQISGNLTVGILDGTQFHDFMHDRFIHQPQITAPPYTNISNLSVSIVTYLPSYPLITSNIPNNQQSAGWQHMSFDVSNHKEFKEEYYAVSISATCKEINCSKLDKTHDNGVRFFFSCIGGLIWSILAVCAVSIHGISVKLKKSTISKVFASCLCIGLIPEILIIVFQIMFSDADAFCGMYDVFDELIEEHISTQDTGYVVISSNYPSGSCQYKNSNISSFPITWIPGVIMLLLFMLLCVYKPLSPFVRRIFNTCSCCVDRKISDSVIPVKRYFSFSGRDAKQSFTSRAKFISRKYSGSVN